MSTALNSSRIHFRVTNNELILPEGSDDLRQAVLKNLRVREPKIARAGEPQIMIAEGLLILRLPEFDEYVHLFDEGEDFLWLFWALDAEDAPVLIAVDLLVLDPIPMWMQIPNDDAWHQMPMFGPNVRRYN